MSGAPQFVRATIDPESSLTLPSKITDSTQAGRSRQAETGQELSIGDAHTNDNTDADLRVSMLMAFGTGAAIGPLAAGT